MKHVKGVGKPHPRLDGPETVTGRATYTVDVVLPPMLHAKLFRSSVPHAEIRQLDASRARALPGVLAVLTAGAVTRQGVGPMVLGEEVLAIVNVRRDRNFLVADHADARPTA